MEIKLLPEETISRIAAGEVIERPLNVVKELVENSIDAGSTAVTIEIRDGGISLIRVTDNGCGIEKEQISRAFVRHATSKIRDVEDLSCLSSLGFRGEALASIAAVAQVEMITKVRGAVFGTRACNDHLAAYSPDAPVRIDLEQIGAPDGTTVIVRNLFGSIPVRRRFLRQPQTEAGYITDLVEKQALSHPGISFHYRVNGQEKLHTSGNGDLRELIYRIYGRETAAAVIPVHAQDPSAGMTLSGFLGKPEISRSSRSFETFFINGRMLRSKELSAGLEEGYRTDLMQHRFPFAVLHLTMPPQEVDVNVHPSKMEVRFTDRRAVFRFLESSVHSALQSTENIPKAGLATASQERRQKREEEREKAAKLQSSPRYEAFETPRTKNISHVSAPSAAVHTDPADTIKYTAEGLVRDATDAAVHTDPADPIKYTAEGLVRGATAAADPADDFVFEDKRPSPAPPAAAATPGSILFEKETAAGQAVRLTPDEAAGNTPPPEETDSSHKALPENADGSQPGEQQETKAADEFLLTRENARKFRFLGQIFGTYWMIEVADQLLIIDQHAAHEKVNYERMMRRIEREFPGLETEVRSREAAPEEYLALDRLLQNDRKEDSAAPVFVASQPLLVPIVLKLSGREEAAYTQFKQVFTAMGFEIEEFGGASYAIRAVPAELFGRTADRLFREILEEIISERISGTPRAVIARIASMACKAAVKGNRRLSEAEAHALIDELLTLENPYHCPHGRPTMIVMSQREMDRKFRRIL